MELTKIMILPNFESRHLPNMTYLTLKSARNQTFNNLVSLKLAKNQNLAIFEPKNVLNQIFLTFEFVQNLNSDFPKNKKNHENCNFGPFKFSQYSNYLTYKRTV